MRKWIDPQPITVPPDLQAFIGDRPLAAEILARRGITTPEAARSFLDPDAYTPASPFELPGMEEAAARVEAAIHLEQPICVWGDFDVDGQTSTTLLVSGLRVLGAKVSFHIPVRAVESHGVNLPALQRVIEQGARLILTCDTGITAHEAVDYAKSRGVDVIVTDHHDPPPTLPSACAILNPKLLPNDHPLASLPGVGVAYQLAEALFQRAGQRGRADIYLDLVALGVVADLALLTGDTRYLLQRGMAGLRAASRLGLIVLMEKAEIEPSTLTEEHIAYGLAPRLNALGRLADANPAVELLTTDDSERAALLVAQLEGLNARRKLLTDQVFQGALAQIDRDPSLLDRAVLVLANPSWPAGVIGIVASRLVERFNRPTVLLSNPPGEAARGSARSIPGCNITAAIASQGRLLNGFGGHPMAAGLSIDAGRIPEFRRGLAGAVQEMLGDNPEPASLPIDAHIPLADLSIELAADIEQIAPFGPGNPALTLAASGLVVKSRSALGRGGEHLQLILEDMQGNAHKAVWWQGAGLPLPEGRFDLAYHLRARSYQGIREVQVEWVDARPLAPEAITIDSRPAALQFVDYRLQKNPAAILKGLLAEADIQVWCEAGAVEALEEIGVRGYPRHGLLPATALAIWTTPPGPQELQAVMERVSPRVVYLFAIDPADVQPERFLKRLAAMTKYALNNQQGRASLSTLAAALAQRETAVRIGLAWLAARGHLALLSEGGDDLQLGPGEASQKQPAGPIGAHLNALLDEVAAYRKYFKYSDLEQIRNGTPHP